MCFMSSKYDFQYKMLHGGFGIMNSKKTILKDDNIIIKHAAA